MDSVNNPIQVIGVKALALADLAAIRAELFQLLENLLQTLVGADCGKVGQRDGFDANYLNRIVD